jgi:hypothetical protein
MRMNVLKLVACGVLAIVGAARGGEVEAVRERLVAAGKASAELRGKAEEWEGAKRFGIEALVPEDRKREMGKRFARASEVSAYIRARGWSVAYWDWPRWGTVEEVVEEWPTEGAAGALVELLRDQDGAVRSLAVEALGALGRAEDVGRIAALLDDRAEGAVVLGWSRQVSSQGWFSAEANPIVAERTWHERTVGTYAREALKLMTGHRFDGEDPKGVTFAEWWKTHDLGRASLWYWQERLRREERAVAAMTRKPGETTMALRDRTADAIEARKAAIHRATVTDLRKQPADVQWKVFLLAQSRLGDTVEVTGPANPLWPEGPVPMMLGAGRLKELTEGEMTWTDIGEVEGARAIMLGRLARVIDEVTAGYGNPPFFKKGLVRAIEREAKGARWRAALVSRLMERAEGARYLEKALGEEKENFTREVIAGERVRAHLGEEWGFLEKAFREEAEGPGEAGSSVRTGILRVLGEEPHTAEKARRLAELLEDPRNETLFTRENQRMGMDMCRYWAMRSVDAIAGKKVVTNEVEEGFKNTGKANWALGELRRVARELAVREAK